MINKNMEKRFGMHPILQLHCLEWLESTMHAKTVKFDIGSGGTPPEVTWEDRCAAIAMIKSMPARALATLLLWGYNQAQFDIVAEHLAGKMSAQCRVDKKAMPKGCPYTIDVMAGKMAKMVLYFTLYDLWDLYTVEGRLTFSGIEMNDRTYSNQLLGYQRLMMGVLRDLGHMINENISGYRKNLNQGGSDQ